MHTVECNQVSKTYQQGKISVNALKDVSVSIETGSFVSFCGPSGSGKTTLLNLIGGLDRPNAGTITIADTRIDNLERAKAAEMRLHKVGFIFQAYNLIPVLSAIENVSFVMNLQGIDKAEATRKSKEMLAAVGLEGMENRRPSELSGGQQQRVAVARAIVTNPSLVLADEPTANLDSKSSKNLLELMRKMNKELSITFVFSTHDELVMDYAERLIRLQDGCIIADDHRN